MPALSALALAITPKAQAQFNTGNIVVLQSGDGSAALTGNATAVFLKEYNPATANQASAVSSVTIPTSGTPRLTITGNGNTEGLMTLSTDSMYLVIAGYDAATGTASLTSSTSATINRVIDTVSKLGLPGRAASTASGISGAGFRSAVKNTGDNYWGSGGASGTYYFGNAATPVSVQTTSTNNRGLLAANGNLYTSSGAGTNGIYKITGQPTVAGTATLMVSLGTSTQPLALAVNPSETIVYVADSRNVAPGGIQRWDYASGTWTNTYNFSLGTSAANGANGLVVDWSGANPVIYATSGDASANRLIKLVDNGMAATYTVLATAPANTVFRGVAFAPKSSAGCINPVITATPTARKCAANGSVILSVTSAVTPTYAWTGPGSFTATTQNISNLAAGTYSVTATVSSGCATTASVAVLDSAQFTATLMASTPTTVCKGDSVLLTALSGAGYTYQFNNASGAILSATASTYNAGVSGSYTVIIVAGPNCTATSAPVSVTVNPRPDTTITPTGIPAICSGDTVKLHAVAATGATYQWRNTAGNISGATDSTYKTFIAGDYKIVVTSGNGCTDSSYVHTVMVNVRPVAVLTTPTDTACQRTSIPVTATTNVNYRYQWFAFGMPIGNTTSTLPVYGLGVGGGPGLFITDIYVVITNADGGCTDTSDVKYLVFRPLPQPLITNTAGELGTTGSYNTYQWLKNSTIIPGATSATYTPAANGSYNVRVADRFGCSDTSATPLVINSLGIAQVQGINGISIYPNPAASVLYIKSSIPVNIEVRNMQGRVMLKAAQPEAVDISALASGVYMISATDKAGMPLGIMRFSKTNQ